MYTDTHMHTHTDTHTQTHTDAHMHTHRHTHRSSKSTNIIHKYSIVSSILYIVGLLKSCTDTPIHCIVYSLGQNTNTDQITAT
jgi:hypothetical protein